MEYSFYIKGLKGLYEKDSNLVTIEKLTTMKAENKITDDEFAFITNK